MALDIASASHRDDPIPGDRKGLEKLAKAKSLDWSWSDALDAAENAEALLQVGYAHTVELVTIEELQRAAERESEKIWRP